MNKFTKSLSIYFLPVLGLIFYSCIDAPVSPDGNRITGALYGKHDKLSVNLYSDYFISIGNAPLYLIEGTPEFSLNSFTVPYDLVINEFYGNLIYKYEGIKINNTKPLFLDPHAPESPDWLGYSDFVVRLPVSKHIRTFYLKVISEDKFYQQNYKYVIGPGDTLVGVWFHYPDITRKFSGKIMFLQEEVTEERMLEFPKYGIKSLDEVTFDRIEFTESDISYDPQEVTRTFRNSVPEGSYDYRSIVSLTFGGHDNGSDMNIYEGIRNGMEFTMPLLPLNDLRYKYIGGYQTGAYMGYASKEVVLNPGDEVNIIHKAPPAIISPEDNAVNIYGNDVFKINDDNQQGVYIYEFVVLRNFGVYKHLKYYTTKKELKFSDITCRGFEMQPNSTYYWWVYKLPGFQDIDKLLAVHYLKDSRYNDLELSQVRSFTTGP